MDSYSFSPDRIEFKRELPLGSDALILFRNPSPLIESIVLVSNEAWYSRPSINGTRTSYAAGEPMVLSLTESSPSLTAQDTNVFVSGTGRLFIYARGYDAGHLGSLSVLGDVVTGNIEADSVMTGEGTINALLADTIDEATEDAGVTVEGVLLQDNEITAPGAINAGGVLTSPIGIELPGFSVYHLSEIVTAAGVETAMSTPVPKGSVILSVSANVETALTGGGTSETWSLGVTGDVDKYGTAGYPDAADSLAKNSKSQGLGDFTPLAAAETIKLCAAETGGADAGDTALSVGSVKIVVTYAISPALPDAA